MKKILILSSSNNSGRDAMQGFIENINALSKGDYRVDLESCSDVCIILSEGKSRVFLLSSGRDVNYYDYVYIKTYKGYEELCVALAHTLKKLGKSFSCQEMLTGFARTKFEEYSILSRYDMPIPKTLLISYKSSYFCFNEYRKNLSKVFVLKAADGERGEANFLIDNEADFDTAIKAHPGRDFIGQEYIENKGDFRYLVVGSDVKMIVERKRVSDETHMNNVSQGARAKLIDISSVPTDIKIIAEKSSKILGREIAGVDILFDKNTGRPFVIEVNASPQVASSSFLSEKLSVFNTFFKSIC